MSKVINKIVKQELINWKNLKWFQPEKLKSTNQTITQKLKTSLIKNGFSMPFNVWQKGKDLWILDGHYRFSAMNAMESEGVEIPEMLPANFINCKNENEAKKLVLVYNSHYANIVKDELIDFVIDLPKEELELTINIPEFNNDNKLIMSDDEINNFINQDILIKDNFYSIILKYKDENKKKEIELILKKNGLTLEEGFENIIKRTLQ